MLPGHVRDVAQVLRARRSPRTRLATTDGHQRDLHRAPMTGEGQTHGPLNAASALTTNPLSNDAVVYTIIAGDVSHEVPTQNYPLLSGQTRTEQVAARLWNLFYS